MKRRTLALPAMLAFIGILLIVGCIPVPGTRQFMTNGNLKPSWKIGNASSEPIWLGHTSIVAAINFLDIHLAGSWYPKVIPWGDDNDRRTIRDVENDWVSVGPHTYAVKFRLREWFIVMPLCAAVAPTFSDNRLILETDDADRVIGYRIMSEDDFSAAYRKWSPLPDRIEDSLAPISKPRPAHR